MRYALALLLLASGASAQVAPEVQVCQLQRPLYKALSGHLDLALDFAISAYQSVTEPDEVAGIGKRIFYVNKDAQEIVSLGAFGGIRRSDNHGVAGPTGQVPGSLLDFLLGTKMGDAWLPRLKTGMFFGWDITRPRDLKVRPDFIGVGVNWPMGSK